MNSQSYTRLVEFIDTLELPEEKQEELLILIEEYGNEEWQSGVDFNSGMTI